MTDTNDRVFTAFLILKTRQEETQHSTYALVVTAGQKSR